MCFSPLSKQLSNAMHERHPKCHPPGDFSPAERWECGCAWEHSHHLSRFADSAGTSPFLFKLYVCFYVLALCLVSYNPVGADPKPCFKKNQITLYPECVLQIKSINRSFLQIYEGLGPRATNCFRRWTHKFWLIFPSECFSLEMPPNDLSHNYTLYNTIFFITTDDSCAGQLSPFVTQAMPSSHLHWLSQSVPWSILTVNLI